ncbi:MAG: hypothetical protein KDE54_34275, partial [Caldilineaceae bacterium]|nr:hypothetical protein [Caldilineaceae bacterium]
GGFNGGLHIVDIGEAATRSTVRAHLQSVAVKDVALAGEYLYAIDGGSLKIYDTVHLLAPRQIGAFALDAENALAVDAQFAYLSNNQGDVLVLDVSEPAQVKAVASYKGLGYVNAM